MTIYEELKRRGFIYQETDSAAIEKKLTTEQVTFYCGFDPTGSSLHVGHLLPVMAMRLLQKAGHIPIALVGGATGMIGDPSGRSSARVMMTLEEIAANAESLKKQLAYFITLENGKAHFVNNADWLTKMSMIEFLRDVGSRFSVNRMLAQKSVESRLENGLSYLEFSYSLLQGYDFYHLNKTLNCTLEIGGQDQWGNMAAGTEFIRRSYQDETKDVHFMTIPLLMNPATGQKFGKSVGGASVWLDTTRTSPFEYYQFWRNCDDSMLPDLLKRFAIELPVEECEALAECGNVNRAKEILACEATALAHGEKTAREVFAAAGTRFGFADPEGKIPTTSKAAAPVSAEVELPVTEIDAAEFGENGITVPRLLVLTGICKSTSDGRRLIQGGAVSIDDVKVTDPNFAVTADQLPLTLKSGKKKFRRLAVKG